MLDLNRDITVSSLPQHHQNGPCVLLSILNIYIVVTKLVSRLLGQLPILRSNPAAVYGYGWDRY